MIANTLVIGTSHVNSLAAARAEAGPVFGDVRFLTSSLWSLSAVGTTVRDGRLALREDPIAFLEGLSSECQVVPDTDQSGQLLYRRRDGQANNIATNVRDFYDPENPDAETPTDTPPDLVVAVLTPRGPSTDPDWVAQFDAFDEGYSISLAVAEHIELLGGQPDEPLPLNWGVHVFGGHAVADLHVRFSCLNTLQQIASLYPDARKVFCIQPPYFSRTKTAQSAERRAAHARRLEKYLGIVRGIYAEIGFEVCPFPIDCLDESGEWLDIEYSIRPRKMNRHLNAAYGQRLWREIERMVRDGPPSARAWPSQR